MTDEFNKGYEAAKQASKVIIDKLTARIIDMEFEIQRANVICENKDWSANNYVARAEKRIKELEAALEPFADAAIELSPYAVALNDLDTVCYDYFRAGQIRAARAALGEKE